MHPKLQQYIVVGFAVALGTLTMHPKMQQYIGLVLLKVEHKNQVSKTHTLSKLFCPASQSAAARLSCSAKGRAQTPDVKSYTLTPNCFAQNLKMQQHVFLFVQHPKVQQHVLFIFCPASQNAAARLFVLSSIPKCSSTFFFVQHPKKQQHVFLF
jgi:hypothetical protein